MKSQPAAVAVTAWKGSGVVSCNWAKAGGGRREKLTKTRLVRAARRRGGFIRKLRIVPYFGIFIRK